LLIPQHLADCYFGDIAPRAPESDRNRLDKTAVSIGFLPQEAIAWPIDHPSPSIWTLSVSILSRGFELHSSNDSTARIPGNPF
jgi:hypothetical protein